MLPQGNGRDTGEQLLLQGPEPRSNPAAIRGSADEDEVHRLLAKEAREGGPARQDRRPDGAISPADKPDGEQQAGDRSADEAPAIDPSPVFSDIRARLARGVLKLT